MLISFELFLLASTKRKPNASDRTSIAIVPEIMFNYFIIIWALWATFFWIKVLIEVFKWSSKHLSILPPYGLEFQSEQIFLYRIMFVIFLNSILSHFWEPSFVVNQKKRSFALKFFTFSNKATRTTSKRLIPAATVYK